MLVTNNVQRKRAGKPMQALNRNALIMRAYTIVYIEIVSRIACMCDQTSVLKITCAAYLGSDATFILK